MGRLLHGLPLALCLLLLAAPLRAQWQQGTGRSTGEVNALAVAGPRIFAGTAGSIYRSDDDGRHWTAVNQGLPTQHSTVNALLVKGATVFAGLFNPGRGVYRSDDNGATWQATGLHPNAIQAPNFQITALAQRGNELWAATGTTIFRSTDDAITWEIVNEGLDLTRPSSPIGALVATTEGVYTVRNNQGVYRLDDGGMHWELVLPDGDLHTLSAVNNVVFAGGNAKVYRAAGGGPWQALTTLTNLARGQNSVLARGSEWWAASSDGIFKSADAGVTWEPGGFYNSASGIALTPSAFLATTSNGLIRSEDDWQTWEPTVEGMVTYTVPALFADGDVLLMGTEGYSLLRSTDQGGTWRPTLYPYSYAYALARNGAYLFAGSSGAGIARSADNGQTWSFPGSGPIGLLVPALLAQGGAVYAGTSSGVFKSTDNGDNWTPLPGVMEGQFVNGLYAHAGVLFAGTFSGLFRSTDEGASWQAVPGVNNVNGMATIGADLYAGGYTGLHRSGDAGATWTRVGNAGFFPVTSLLAHEDILFAGTYQGGVYRSADRGESWTRVNEGFNNPSVRSLAVTADRLVAGTYNTGAWYRPLVELLPAAPVTGLVRINAGGAKYTTADNVLFAADAHVTGGTVSALGTGEVGNTTEDALYRTLRFGPSFAYGVPVPNGTYDVTLHFNETYWGYRVPGGVRSRRFHVDVEGARKLTNYDIYQRARGAMRAVQETFRVTVTDGTLDVAFAKGSADYPAVAALEAVPVAEPGTFLVNAGGAAYTTTNNRTFAGDSYFAGGTRSTPATGVIAGTAEQALFQTGRHGASFSYNFPTGNGTYDVVLYFTETYWGNLAAGGAGSRKFHVEAEGQRRLTEYDIFATAGGAMKAVQESFRVTVTDGTLNVHFRKGSADLPAVKAIEVLPVTVGRLAGAVTLPTATGAGLRPNPAVDRVRVRLDDAAGAVQRTAVTDALGITRLVNGHRPVGGGFELDVRSLRPGAYLLTVTTDGGPRLFRFVKQ